jgi:hypothetical protein
LFAILFTRFLVLLSRLPESGLLAGMPVFTRAPEVLHRFIAGSAAYQLRALFTARVAAAPLFAFFLITCIQR